MIHLCEPVVRELGFRVVDVDCCLSGHAVVRLFIERVEPSQRVSVDDCTQVTRALDGLFETESWLTGAFDLEVSSPGLDKRLRLVEDFKSQTGQIIKIELQERMHNRQRATGRIRSVEENVICLDVDGQEFRVPVEKIKRAHLVWQNEGGKRGSYGI